MLALPHGNTTFRSTSVKPYLIPTNQIKGIEIEPANRELAEPPPPAKATKNPASNPALLPAKRTRGRPRKHQQITILLTEADQTERQFQTSRQAEVLGLLEKGVFKVAHIVPQGIRIFNSRFVNKVKNKGTDKAFIKSRLVV